MNNLIIILQWFNDDPKLILKSINFLIFLIINRVLSMKIFEFNEKQMKTNT